MSVINEIALEAARSKRAEAAVHEAEIEYERERHQIQQIKTMIKDSPLRQWFPGVEWEVYLPEENIITPADRLSGTNPELTTITLKLRRDSREKVIVVFASSNNDSDTHYTYWSGPEVQSAADVGQALEARIGRAGDSWLGHKCASCGFRGNKVKPVGNGFLCVSLAACERRKQLVASGNAAPPS